MAGSSKVDLSEEEIDDKAYWEMIKSKYDIKSDTDSDKENDSDYDSDNSDVCILEDPIYGPIYKALLRDDGVALIENLPHKDDGKPDCYIPFGLYQSLLHRACMTDEINCAKALIKNGCNIMAGQGSKVGIPFHLAICHCSLPLIEFMIDDARSKGGDTLHKMIHSKNSSGVTPLNIVRRSPYEHIIMPWILRSSDPFSSSEAQPRPPGDLSSPDKAQASPAANPSSSNEAQLPSKKPRTQY